MRDYFENPAISRSDLAKLSSHPKSYKSSFKGGGDALRLGSAFDDLMFFPDTWHDQYHVFQNDAPAGAMKTLCDRYAFLVQQDSWQSHEDMFADAYTASGYQISKKAVEARFKKEGIEYYKEKAKHLDKVGISTKEAQMFEAMRGAILADNNIKKYFVPDGNVELHFQLPVYWDETVYVEGESVIMPCRS